MEHAPLVARLLKEVDVARAAIAASYLRLWRLDRGSPAETFEPADPQGERPGADVSRGERPSRGAG